MPNLFEGGAHAIGSGSKAASDGAFLLICGDYLLTWDWLLETSCWTWALLINDYYSIEICPQLTAFWPDTTLTPSNTFTTSTSDMCIIVAYIWIYIMSQNCYHLPAALLQEFNSSVCFRSVRYVDLVCMFLRPTHIARSLLKYFTTHLTLDLKFLIVTSPVHSSYIFYWINL